MTPASVQAGDGGKRALTALRRVVRYLKVTCADQAYKALLFWTSVRLWWCIEMMKRPRSSFVLHPRRRIVERRSE
jgi:hypothetical protein